MRQTLPRSFPFLVAIWLCLNAHACQSQPPSEVSFAEKKAVLEATKSRAAYDSLHILLAEHYLDLSAADRTQLRAMLEKHAVWPFEKMCPDAEPGLKIAIKGLVTNENGLPVPGANLYIFQTDARGYYTPTDSASGKMGENDARLNGFLTTDSAGFFEIYTVRPASYPKQYRGRTIPQHIHLVTHADGFRGNAVQMVFKDDPAMTDYWVDWAQKQGYPIVELLKTGAEMRGNVTLHLNHANQ